jgi:hypothetical protein
MAFFVALTTAIRSLLLPVATDATLARATPRPQGNGREAHIRFRKVLNLNRMERNGVGLSIVDNAVIWADFLERVQVYVASHGIGMPARESSVLEGEARTCAL